MQIRLEERKPQNQRPSKFCTVILWILTGFMFISGVVFIPSAASANQFWI